MGIIGTRGDGAKFSTGWKHLHPSNHERYVHFQFALIHGPNISGSYVILLMEVRNRFKGLDLTDRVPDELWTEIHDLGRDTGIKTIPMKKKCNKSKMAV